MSLVTVLATTALVVLLLYAYAQWGPGGPDVKRGVGVVTVVLLLLFVLLWALRARGVV